jgi:vacuolar protein sorting-associated protein IST1
MGNDAPKFKSKVLKANLKMAISRFCILKNKRINANHKCREEIASLLRQGNEELARIKVEAVINNENYMAAIDILCMLCQVCSERLGTISKITKAWQPPADIRYAVETLIWAASRSDCPEMLKIRSQFFALYGDSFCRAAVGNYNGVVNSVVRHK